MHAHVIARFEPVFISLVTGSMLFAYTCGGAPGAGDKGGTITQPPPPPRLRQHAASSALCTAAM